MPHGKKLGKEKLYDREDINFEDPGRVCFFANIIKILRKLIFSLSHLFLSIYLIIALIQRKICEKFSTSQLKVANTKIIKNFYLKRINFREATKNLRKPRFFNEKILIFVGILQIDKFS